MSENNVITGIKCEAKNCKHHTANDYCTAGHIQVECKDATTKSETFCKTFEKNENCCN